MVPIEYWIRVKKQNRPEVRKKYPNLTAPIWPTITSFQHPEDLARFSDEKIRKIVGQELEKVSTVKTDHPIRRREVVDLRKNVKNGGRVWRGRMEMPENVVEASRRQRGEA